MFESLWLKLRITYKGSYYKVSYPTSIWPCSQRKGFHFYDEGSLIEYVKRKPHRRPPEFRGFLDYQSHNLEKKIYAEDVES